MLRLLRTLQIEAATLSGIVQAAFRAHLAEVPDRQSLWAGLWVIREVKLDRWSEYDCNADAEWWDGPYPSALQVPTTDSSFMVVGAVELPHVLTLMPTH